MDIPIEGYGAQVEDGGSGAHDVTRHPRVAELLTENPVPGDNVIKLDFRLPPT